VVSSSPLKYAAAKILYHEYLLTIIGRLQKCSLPIKESGIVKSLNFCAAKLSFHNVAYPLMFSVAHFIVDSVLVNSAKT